MSLTIPDSGLLLESSAKSKVPLPQQAFAITLNDSVIEDMIACVQNGESVQLSLGSSPALLYGSHEYRISQDPETSTLDLFLTDPSESKFGKRLPKPTMSILSRPPAFPKTKAPARVEKQAKESKAAKEAKPVKESKPPASAPAPAPAPVPVPPKQSAATPRAGSDLDSDIEHLQLSLAQAEAQKKQNTTTMVDIPSKRAGVKTTKSKLLNSKNSGSRPSSPALSAASPSFAPTSSQSALERAKEQRFPIIHELAVEEQSYADLLVKWTGGSNQDFKSALEKVADLNQSSQKWVLKRMYWKELDVWKYKYNNQEDRQQAIDNAVRQFDRMRLAASDPQWDRLLPKEERGKGKSLSKVQVNFAKELASKPAVPKLKVQKAGGSSPESVANADKGGESMARSTSNQSTKSRKPSEKEAQAKRLLSNKPRASTPKVSPTKANQQKAAVPKDKGGKVALSKEFVSDSDSEDEEKPLAKTKPKPVEKAKEPVVKPKARPAVAKEPARTKDPVKAKVPISTKRPRDDDDSSSSSSSGTPLSKRLKPQRPQKPLVKAPLKPAKQPSKAPTSAPANHTPDTSQNSRAASNGVSFKSKNTSPAKSSPLASSPPTNASDLDAANESTTTNSSIVSIKKRKATDDASDISKRKRARPSHDVMNKAQKFKTFYEKYETLHYDLEALENPPEDKILDLWDMRQRLERLKREIQKEALAEA